MTTLITGSRNTNQAMLDTVTFVLRGIHHHGRDVIVGDASGIDEYVIQLCDDMGIPVMVCGGYGKLRRKSRITPERSIVVPGSWLDRNLYMIDRCTNCVAIWDGSSRGTLFTWTHARRKGITTTVYKFSGDKYELV